MNLYVDIETIPTQRPDVRDHIEQSMRAELDSALQAVCAPSNYKDAEKIAAYCEEKKASLRAEFAGKVADKIGATGLDGAFGHVFCVGWAVDDGPVTTRYGLNERTLLQDLASLIRVPHTAAFDVCVIGHNVSAFDLRFLAQRHIVHGIRPPLPIARAAQAKPWESDKVFDTMVQWAGVGGRISLDKLCLALGIASPKGELDGSKVWEWVQAGRHDEVAQYCERDVEAVRAVHRRMTFQSVQTVEQLDDVPA